MTNKDIERGTFQILFVVGTIIVLFIVAVIFLAVFVDPAALSMLIPFVFLGIAWVIWFIGGKVYDRINRD